MTSENEIESIVTAIKQSKKYRDTSEETIRELAAVALSRHKKTKDATKAVRKRLHSIMAPYLGDPDYEAAAQDLDSAFAAGDSEQIKSVCQDALYSHLSTRERLPIMDAFYQEIYKQTGKPDCLLDIACGLNPLAFPWMNLPTSTRYLAYDIHVPRVHFINHYFQLQGLPPLARLQDVALHFPQEEGDVALFLKEMPRFERNYPGTGRKFLEALLVKFIVISFPAVSTHGGRNLTGRYREFFAKLTDGFNWRISELSFAGELVFIAEKPG